MAQFYFLSVLLNILCGLILIYGTNLALKNDSTATASLDTESMDAEDKENAKKSISEEFKGFDNKTFRLVVGILSAFVGILKFLSVYRNDIPVIGDLLPALAGLAGGASLLLEYYISTTTEEVNISDKIIAVFVDSRKYIGIACLIVGVLHFIFPQVPIL